MPSIPLVSHQSQLERFRRSLRRGRLASTYLLVGPEGIGKRTFALRLAQGLLCQQTDREPLEPCGECSGCRQVAQQTHPDLLLVSKPEDKSFLPVELLIGRKEKRRREGLVHDIGLKPFKGGYRVAIIDDADTFNAESANSLLKTLEEPPPHSLILLLGTSQQRQLPTIISRSQVVRFAPLETAEVRQILERLQAADPDRVSPEVSLDLLAAASGGSVARALQLAQDDCLSFRRQLWQQLTSGDPHAGDFTREVTQFVDAAGKEGYRKRPRLNLVGDLAIEFYQACMLLLATGTGIGDDQELRAAAEAFAQRWSGADPGQLCERLADCVDRCCQLQAHVLANAGLPNATESWLIDTGRLLRGQPVTTGAMLAGVV